MKYLHELEECKLKKPPRVYTPTATRQKRKWIAPPSGMAKIRVDGVVARSVNEGAFRAVCRNSEGIFMGSSAIRCHGVTDPTTLEALACREALALEQDLALSHIVIASDCQGVVCDIGQGCGGTYASIVKEVTATSAQFQHCTFIFEGHETNQEAHSLTKHAFRLGLGRHVWLLNPSNLSCIPMNILVE